MGHQSHNELIYKSMTCLQWIYQQFDVFYNYHIATIMQTPKVSMYVKGGRDHTLLKGLLQLTIFVVILVNK